MFIYTYCVWYIENNIFDNNNKFFIYLVSKFSSPENAQILYTRRKNYSASGNREQIECDEKVCKTCWQPRFMRLRTTSVPYYIFI